VIIFSLYNIKQNKQKVRRFNDKKNKHGLDSEIQVLLIFPALITSKKIAIIKFLILYFHHLYFNTNTLLSGYRILWLTGFAKKKHVQYKTFSMCIV